MLGNLVGWHQGESNAHPSAPPQDNNVMFNTEPPAGARAVPGGECQGKPWRRGEDGWAPTVQLVKERLGSGVRPELKACSVLTCCMPIGKLTSPSFVTPSVKWG